MQAEFQVFCIIIIIIIIIILHLFLTVYKRQVSRNCLLFHCQQRAMWPE